MRVKTIVFISRVGLLLWVLLRQPTSEPPWRENHAPEKQGITDRSHLFIRF